MNDTAPQQDDFSNDIFLFNAHEIGDDGLVGIGGDLASERIIAAYKKGIFPWEYTAGGAWWFSPNPRCVLYPEKIFVSKSMQKVMASDIFFGAGALLSLLAVFFGYSFHLDLYGIGADEPFSPRWFIVLALFLFKAFTAVNLLRKTDMAIRLALADAFAGILTCLITMATSGTTG